MRAVDIIEARLSHLEVRLDSVGPYQWAAQCSLEGNWIFQGNGFTPGQAVEALYSIMLRHLDRQADGRGLLAGVPPAPSPEEP
jgi:hypothetical protein